MFPLSTYRLGRGPHRSRLGRLLPLLAGCAVIAAAAAAPTQPDAPAKRVVIRTAGEFWNVPEAERKRPLPVDMEMTVYHYDPGWKLLYARMTDGPSYLPATGQAMPIRTGQRVRLRGTVVQAVGFDGANITVTVLADDQLPAPRPTAGRMDDLAHLNGQWVEMEGYVLSQNEPDATHIETRLWSEGRLVDFTIMMSGTEPVPTYAGARVRAQGVYDVGVDSFGAIQHRTLWTTSRSPIKVLGWVGDDERFKLPPTPIERLAAAASQPWVRIVGRVKAQELGVSLTVRDETDQVEIATVQPDAIPVGAAVEVVGRVVPHENGWTLTEPFFHRLDLPPANRDVAGGLPVRLRLADQVLELSPEQADKHVPVSLRGVVTWYDERSREFYLQDASGGVAVNRPPDTSLSYGASVTVTGTTVRGPLRPAVEATHLEQTGVVALPPARRISLDQAQTGADEGRLVEMNGYVRQVRSTEAWTRLDLTAKTGEYSAYLPRDPSLADLKGSIVWARGVDVLQPGASPEFPEIRLWSQGRESIVVTTPPAADPFQAATLTFANVHAQAATEPTVRLVKVRGTVTFMQPGRYLYLQDGDNGLFVLTRETARVPTGQRVELVGIPGRLANRFALREGIWRPVAGEDNVRPVILASAVQANPRLDTRLVTIEGNLRFPVRETAGWRLSLDSGGGFFEASMAGDTRWTPPAAGSKLALTGVYVQEFDEYRHPHDFHLELRSPADIAILARPSWWTAQRTLYAVGGLLCCTLLVLGWVFALRRQVRSQTEQIRQQMENEVKLQAELERSSRLESLGVLAGGIAHDFNNLLTAILGNLGLAAMDSRVMAAAGDCLGEAERAARRARDVTQQLLTFAKGGDPLRSAVLLPDIITEAANFARHGSNVRLEFNFPRALPPADVDAGQISRVVHNLVINAVQAMPGGGLVTIGLQAVDLKDRDVDQLPAGRYLELTVSDTGAGIAPEIIPRIFDPYFSTKTKNHGLGLATVRSIVKKHNGHIEVESRQGQGTTFRLWLPAASALGTAPASPGVPVANGPARVLVMDDEEVIRRVAGRMLALAGHETAFAADGADALRAYDEAARGGRPFDLVIFDLTVPGGMGGREALASLLQAHPNARAIASSGYSNDPVMANPRDFGFRTQLSKPYEYGDLVRAVDEARRA